MGYAKEEDYQEPTPEETAKSAAIEISDCWDRIKELLEVLEEPCGETNKNLTRLFFENPDKFVQEIKDILSGDLNEI